MKKKAIAVMLALLVSGGATAAYIHYESHTHIEEGSTLGHSGGLDSYGGHNCSEASKRKGLCSGYHYHR